MPKARLKVTIDGDIYETGGYDPDDPWSRNSTDGRMDPVSVELTEDDGYPTEPVDFEVKRGDTVFVLYCNYTTGDTFGSDGGQYETIAIYKTAEKAYDACKLIDEYVNSPERPKHRLIISLENGDEYTQDWWPWDGYFESLDFVEVKELRVR